MSLIPPVLGEPLDPCRETAPAEPTGIWRREKLQVIREDAVYVAPDKRLMMARRQAIIIELGAIEDYLGMERSIVPRRKR